MTEKITRRDFLKLSAASVASLALRRFPAPDAPINNEWEIPTIEQRKELLAKTEFFTQPQDASGRIFLTKQFSDVEYSRLTPELVHYLESSKYKNNACSEAVIATAVKTFGYFRTGEVADVTIADVINYLMDKNHDGFQYIRKNNVTMYDDVLKWALELYGQETSLFSVVKGFTPDRGISNRRLVPPSEWAAIFKKGREEVLDKGGILVARVLKYGTKASPQAHFIIMSSLNKGGEPLIVDSIGPKVNGERPGLVRTVALSAYAEKAVDPAGTILMPKPGLFWLIGLIPSF